MSYLETTRSLNDRAEWESDWEKASSYFRADAVDLRARLEVIAVHSIETVHEQYTVEYQLEVDWEDEVFCQDVIVQPKWQRGAEEKGWQRQMMSTCWHPNLKVLNEIELKRKEIWYRVAPPSTIVYCYRALGVYHESFELEAFPFDCQNRRANPSGAMVFVIWVHSRDFTGSWAVAQLEAR
jgi:hypothetical protein